MGVKTLCKVISLATATARRSTFTDSAKDCQVSWEFFDAHTSLQNGLLYDEDRAIVRRGRPLVKAELGCYSSHYATWVTLIESDADQLIVLEDDSLVDWEYLAIVRAHDFAADGLNYVRLASLALPPSILKGEYLDRYLVLFLGYALGTQAYLVTRKGAERLMKYCKTVRGPIDDALDQTWWGALPNYAIYHHPVAARAVPSSISGSRDAGYTMPARLRFRRLLFRVAEKLRSRGYRMIARLGCTPRVQGVDDRWT
jgi:glycosyl transferase, family 25